MSRGEVWWVVFDRAVGGQARKSRPALMKRRLPRRSGRIAKADMAAVERAIRIQLGL